MIYRTVFSFEQRKMFGRKHVSKLALLGISLGLLSSFYSGNRNGIDSNFEETLRVKLPEPAPLCKKSETDDTKGPIYFIDAAGSACFTPLQACSIESAALANPTMSVILYSNTEEEEISDSNWDDRMLFRRNTKNCDLRTLLRNVYPNLSYEKINMHQKIGQSRLKELVTSGALDRSFWRSLHMQHALSWVLAEEMGGIYLDSNIMTFRSLNCIQNSLFLAGDQVSPDVFALKKGSDLAKFFMRYAPRVYQPEDTTTLGGPIVSSTFKLFCSQKHLSQGTFSCHKDLKIHLRAKESFFLVDYSQRHVFYQRNPHDIGDINFDQSYGIKAYPMDWNQELRNSSLYAQLMKKFCPVTYRNTLFGS